MGLIFILTCTIFTPVAAQTSGFRLQTADSLFQAKRYTQSLEHYEEILRQHQYTPAMLLKMAYINEGLNRRGSAMYYLNLYHIATGDEDVLKEIDELATKFNLRGYEITDSDRFRTFYHNYRLPISLSLAALMIFFLCLMFYIRTRLHKKPIGPAITLAAISLLLLAHLYYGNNRSSAIIAANTTYIMDGPSAGASVVDIVSDGHRVQILGKKDVWMKIRWDDQVAYVKENAVRPVRL
ncbi:MAG: SH3 domain-containing protein [Bacteroidota bacterium]|nr:SH3 domain-containing protein [Bacteroidota bacterium]